MWWVVGAPGEISRLERKEIIARMGMLWTATGRAKKGMSFARGLAGEDGRCHLRAGFVKCQSEVNPE